MTDPITSDDPISWQAIGYIAFLLERIKTADGYYTDAGSNVVLEPFQLSAEKDVFPTLRVVEDDSSTEDSIQDVKKSVLNLVIESYVSVDYDDSQFKAHKLRADIVKCLPSKTRGFPVYFMSYALGTRKILQRPEGFPYTVVQIRVQVTVLEPTSTK